MFVLLCFIASFLVGWVVCYIRMWNYKKKSLNMPCAPSIPILGTLWLSIKSNLDTLKFAELISEYGDVVTFWLGPFPCAMVESIENVQTFFTNPGNIARTPQSRDLIDPILGVGNVLTSSGAEWSKSRTAFVHSLHSVPRADVWTSILKEAEKSTTVFKQYADGGFFESVPIFRERIFSALAKVSVVQEEDFYFGVADVFQTVLDILVQRILSPIHYFDLTFNFTKTGKIYNEQKRKPEKFARTVLDIAHKELEDYSAKGSKPPTRILHNLLQKYGHESKDFLNSQVITLFATGVDTTANSTSFTLMLLGMNPDVQDQLFEEDKKAQEILDGKPFEVSDLAYYPLLTSVVKESLRLLPVAPLLSRWTLEDVKYGKYIVPAGTNIYCNMLRTQRSEKYFEDPLKFKADRFLPENLSKIPQYAYAPFSMGPRLCLGPKFALMGMKSLVLYTVRNYRIFTEYKDLAELDSNVTQTLTLKDKKNGRIRLETRT